MRQRRQLRDVNQNNNPRIPFWLWPNVLGLDAPVIAVVWQDAIAKAFGTPLPMAARTALFCAVWGVYLADRFADSRRSEAPLADRHLFANRHPRLVLIFTAASLVGGVTSGLYLDWKTWVAAAAIAVSTAIYLIWSHAPGLPRPAPLLKEAAASIIFALGCALVPALMGGTEYVAFWRAVGLFGGLCLVNCSIVDSLSPGGKVRKIPFFCAAAGVLALLSLASIVPGRNLSGFVPACLVAALLLAGAGGIYRWKGARFAAVYCDVALLAPLLIPLLKRLPAFQ